MYLNNLILEGFFRKKRFFFLIFNKKFFYRYNWMKKNKRIYKIKLNFSFFKKKLKTKNLKKMNINKIIKSKRVTGIFKKKFNMRTTILRKKSLIFFFLEDKNKKKKFLKRKKYFRRKFLKNRFLYFYRTLNINISNKVKSIISENRKILNFFLKKKNLNRQNKFNKYIINYLNKSSKSLINMFEYKLSNILVKSHFFNNNSDSDFFIKNGFVTVNNKTCKNSNTVINFGDIIKLKTRFNYYLFYRKNLNKSLKMSKKINWAFYKFLKKDKKKIFFFKVYNWINSSRYFGFDIPYNLEVDFINMTVIVLIKFFDISNIESSNIKYINLYLTRLYNWNYII